MNDEVKPKLSIGDQAFPIIPPNGILHTEEITKIEKVMDYGCHRCATVGPIEYVIYYYFDYDKEAFPECLVFRTEEEAMKALDLLEEQKKKWEK